MSKKRISLNSVKFFFYVATYESVTTASEKLGVTQGAVSRQIKKLENSLNTILFIRKGNVIELTNEGTFLLNCCQNIFQDIDECLIKLNKRESNIKELIVLCEPTLCLKWLIPRINKFNSSFKIKLITDEKTIEYNNIDLFIKRNDFNKKDHIHYFKLADEMVFFVKVPIYNGNTVLISSSRPKIWSNFIKEKLRNNTINPIHYKELDHFYLCIQASLSGLGSTFVSGYMIENELNENTLEPIIEPFHDGSSYFLLSHSPFEEDYRKISFRNWLSEEINKSKTNLEKYSNIQY